MNAIEHFTRYLRGASYRTLRDLLTLTVDGPSPIIATFVTEELRALVRQELEARLNTRRAA